VEWGDADFDRSPQPRYSRDDSHIFIDCPCRALCVRLQIFIVLELITGGELFDKIVAEGK